MSIDDNSGASPWTFDAYKAAITDVHGGVENNLVIGQRLNGGAGVKLTAGMSPADCIEFFAQNGSNIQQLAMELKVANPTLDFKMSAKAPELDNSFDPTGPKRK